VPADDPQKKPRKVPVDPRTGRNASSTDPDTWATFEEAEKALRGGGYDGLMFAIYPCDGYVFIDLDRCRNPQNRTPNAQAKSILRLLNSYSEVSPSGTGVHILVKGEKPGDRCRAGKVEMYDRERFATMTGRVMTKWGTGQIETRQKELEEVYAKHIAISQTTPDRAVPAVPVPEAKLKVLVERHPAAESLYRGTYDGQYPSQSEADLALANYAVRMKWDDAELTALLRGARENAGADQKYPGYYQLTIRRARVPPVDLAAARGTFQEYLHLPDLTILDVILAAVASSHLPGDPCWLHIVGPPSSAKTECINSVSGWPCVYPLSELTPAGLVSGRDSEDGKDHSLLPHLHCKTLAIKDFTPILELPKEHQQKLFSRLRDAFDGSQAIHTAMVGTRAHKGTFNCVTGVTNAIERLWRNTSLGERYLLYRHAAPDPFESAMKALERANEKEYMRKELARTACGVLAGVDQDCVPDCPRDIKEKIVKLAALLATVRTYVERDRDHKVNNLPEPEGPSRIAQQLHKLGQGLVLINRRTEIGEADLPILTRVVLDSMPSIRRKLLGVLAWDLRQRKRPFTATFMQRTGLSQSAVHEQLENLCLLGVCDKKDHSGGPFGTTKNSYGLTGQFRTLIAGVDFGGQ
jgi:hypothetical protein